MDSMELSLNEDALLPEFRDRATSTISFRHFKPEVQVAVRAVGRATFRRFQNYNAIYPPKGDAANAHLVEAVTTFVARYPDSLEKQRVVKALARLASK